MEFRVDACLKSLLIFLQYAPLLFLTIHHGSEATVDHHNYDLSKPTTPTFFFHFKNIKPANKLPFYFPKRKPATDSPFLPKHTTDSIPFSFKDFDYLVSFFSLKPGSKQAIEMEQTLRECEAPPTTGEARLCITSMESLLDFIVQIFGDNDDNNNNNPPILHTTTFRSNDLDTVYQNFTVLSEPKEIAATMMLGCHMLPYQYTVFVCHTQERTKAYRFSLRGDNGDLVDTLSVCHFDTSEWDPNHKSFSELGTKPGDPVCHIFLPNGNLLWVQYNPNNINYQTM